ncbi:hypothetical protein QBC34DRAFT_406516 [Podospora aff. communis PSN243]|uniref:AAA+ ATPase domain-containing protein n=1 Tax=Podospora aff. communis PSN243 TaxID=3040156 RepID=A0AAV9GLF9_9PEZI|nr:hypothetical protein QBC34DRAFT_406516 [Podospora aff. communis PSN243]
MSSAEPATEKIPPDDSSQRDDYLARVDRLLAALEIDNGHRRRRYSSSSSSSGSTTLSDNVLDEEEPQPTVVGVKDCDWEHFVNRFDPEAPVSSIEVLVAGTNLGDQIYTEAKKRSPRGLVIRPVPAQMQRPAINEKWDRMIRVQSPNLLSVFSKVTGYDWGTRPHIFVRPYVDLVSYHDKFKEALQQMEAEEPSSPSLEELRCYLDMAERRVIPNYTRIREANSSGRPGILFDDLWCLFRPGDLIFIPGKTIIDAAKGAVESKRRGPGPPADQTLLSADCEAPWHQRIWRVLYTQPPSPERSLPVIRPADELNTPSDDFNIFCYYLDHDGDSYGAVVKQFTIRKYHGKKHIRGLDVYPLCFAQNHESLLHESKKTGEAFASAVQKKHMLSHGWTCTTDPMAMAVQFPGSTTRVIAPELAEGEVIVDLKETYRRHPSFQNSLADYQLLDFFPRPVVVIPHPIKVWDSPSRSKRIKTYRDVLKTSKECEARELSAQLRTVPFLRASTRPQQPPEGDDLALLTSRIFVYALRLRRFVPVSVTDLKPIPELLTDPFNDLQLPDSHKRVIQATVDSHLKRQAIERQIQSTGKEEVRTQDFISGKGRGLLVMLHGEPGVGKTATAEAVAKSTGRHLFPISCTDLASHVRGSLEYELNEVFRLAHMWDCILLMDEADVFLSSRTSSSIGEDAMVSVFLRKLEYYSGILFLTTNRVGKVDQAISSRIHLILHYKRLGLAATQEIFAVNIRNLEEMERQQFQTTGQPPLYIVKPEVLQFATDHYNKYPKGKGAWNGRQIRNAFLVAASLARYESAGMEGRQAQLRYAHFEEVEKITREYNQFRARVLGGDDARKARLLEERNDDYEGEENHASARPVVSPSPSALSGYQSPRTQNVVASNEGPIQWSAMPTASRMQVGVQPGWTPGHNHAGYAGTIPIIRPVPQQQPTPWQDVGVMSAGAPVGQTQSQPPQGYPAEGPGQGNYLPLRTTTSTGLSSTSVGTESRAAMSPGTPTPFRGGNEAPGTQ